MSQSAFKNIDKKEFQKFSENMANYYAAVKSKANKEFQKILEKESVANIIKFAEANMIHVANADSTSSKGDETRRLFLLNSDDQTKIYSISGRPMLLAQYGIVEINQKLFDDEGNDENDDVQNIQLFQNDLVNAYSKILENSGVTIDNNSQQRFLLRTSSVRIQPKLQLIEVKPS